MTRWSFRKGSIAVAVAAASTLAVTAAAQAQGRRAKPQPERLDPAAVRAGRDLGGDAQKRTVRMADGRVVERTTTSPAFDPRTGAEATGELVRAPEGFVSVQGGLTITVPASTRGAGTRIGFADGDLVVSTAARFYGQAETGERFDLVVRDASGSARKGAVRFAGALGDADLVHAVQLGRLATELVMPALPDAIGASYGTVWFEELLTLPAGWHVEGLEPGQEVVLTGAAAIVDGSGTERAALEAPVIFDASGAQAATYAVVRAEEGNVLGYKVAVPASWLRADERAWPVVVDPTISLNVPVTVTTDGTVTITPVASRWNIVAVSGANQDWDLDFDSAWSNRFDDECDFVAANGNLGTIGTKTGNVLQWFDTLPGTLEHAQVDVTTIGQNASFTFGSTHVARAIQIDVPTARSETFTVSGPSSLRFAIFESASNAWLDRDDAVMDAPLGTYTRTFPAGKSLLVVFKDGGPGASGTVNLTFASASFNLEATGCTLDSASYPAQLKVGDTLNFTRNITRTGNLPAGAQIEYSVYLSTNTTISTSDYEIYNYYPAGAGVLALPTTIPAGVPDGTYYVGLRIVPVTGETSTADNTVYDAVTNHKVVISSAPVTPTINVSAGQKAAVTVTPSNLSVSANAGVWNLVALKGDDWNLTLGGATSALTGSQIDFVVANGNQGTVTSPATGTATRASGTAAAEVMHTSSTLIPAGGQKTYAWAAGQYATIFAHQITATGQHTFQVTGPAGLQAALFGPGTSGAYRARSTALATISAGSTLTYDVTQAGWYGLVVYKDGAAAAAGQVDISIQPVSVVPATYNVAVTGVSLVGATSTPLAVKVGDPVSISRTLAITGQLPAGSSVDYKVYLSADQTIDAQDVLMFQTTGAAQGQATINATVPSIPDGTYYVAVVVDAISGESNAADNTKFEDQAKQLSVSTGVSVMFNILATSIGAQGAPLTLDPGDSFDVDLQVDVVSVPPAGTVVTYRVYLSTNNVITTLDTEVGMGTGSGAQSLTCTVPASMQPGTYYVGVLIDPVTGETSTTDNELASIGPEVTINANASIHLTLATPELVVDPSSTPTSVVPISGPTIFDFTPVQGVWNAIALVAQDPNDDYDLEVGFGYSAGFNPDTEMCLADGTAGQIVDTFGTVIPYSQPAAPAVLRHVTAQPIALNQSASAPWDPSQVILLFQVDVPTAGQYPALISGPTGLKLGTYEPQIDGQFTDRYYVWQEEDLGLVTLDFPSAGTWAIAVFAESGVATTAGQVTIDWVGSVSPGFDLAAVSVSIPAGLQVTPGSVIDVTRVIANLGQQDSPTWAWAVYLSADQTIDPSDVRIFESAAAQPLVALASDSQTVQATVPPNVANGTLHVILEVAQLANDGVPTNGVQVAASTVDVSGGSGGVVTGGSVVNVANLRSGGSGGGCSFDGEGGGPLAPVLLVLFGLAVARLRRR